MPKICFGRISKTEAQEIQISYQREVPHEEVKIFADWLGISVSRLY